MKKEISLFALVLIAGLGRAQITQLGTTVLGTSGTCSTINGNTYCWSVGECMVETKSAGNFVYTQGFEQPGGVGLTGGAPVIYNGITPNGDGINDFWFIDQVDSFANNKVFIYNQWGLLVWHTADYDNVTHVFTGLNDKNEKLPSATYFYIINSDKYNRNGWIELTR